MKKLILLRHGQSKWNLENRFTGLEDVSLSKKGIEEAKEAGKIMVKHNISVDLIFSSILKRATDTARLAVLEMKLNHLWDDNNELIMTNDKALNERNYGDLVGLNKKETSDKFGKEQVQKWRRSFDVSPPGGESLKEVVERAKENGISQLICVGTDIESSEKAIKIAEEFPEVFLHRIRPCIIEWSELSPSLRSSQKVKYFGRRDRQRRHRLYLVDRARCP